MQGEETVRRGECGPALGPSVLASCWPPLAAWPWGSSLVRAGPAYRESLRGNFSSAIAMPFLLLLQGYCCKSSNFPQHSWSPLHSLDPSLPLLVDQPALCLPMGRHGGTEIIGTPTLLQGAQGLLGDTDEVTDHDIPARGEGH